MNYKKGMVLLAGVALLAACGQSKEDTAYNESSSSGTTQAQVKHNARSNKKTSKASSQSKSQSVATNSQAPASQPAPATSGSVAESQPAASAGIVDNNPGVTSDQAANVTANDDLIRQYLDEAVPLINQVSNGMFQSSEYFFMPYLEEDGTLTIEVRRQSPGDQAQTNLITIYSYDHEHGHLMEFNAATGDMQQVN
ncbi:hypothetical protein AWM75_08220 [Aerococcus urinaehominis]|uniref:Uncharacterized protein n=1 Tax=Aerococcus urinaehominis TaxID=128944 RepID=A0A109RI49_9LACT|nr:hypothetical protein [Aerococcus urinaehominis]AMB99956.1 hypothetical protein AWM75_08220 [Aerococcus urinaehominis]SDM44453.1 hypothetical protein SAMN04487985_1174 [Aerococcus urinaehominis]